jgi:hypothetical protein
MTKTATQIAFEALTSEDDGRVCKDIPDKACNDQPENFVTHILSLSLTKTADGLINPKLILSWILTTLGAPSYFIGLLVPIREAGALLPQLFTAGYLRSLPQRKFAWAAGSFAQGASAAGMGIAAMTLKGFALGLTITILLTILALARSVCSVSYKDVLGKTLDQSKRGTAIGTASSLAAASVVIYALLLSSQIFDKLTLVTIGLFLAAGFWMTASLLFTTLTEEKGATEGGGNPFQVAKDHAKYLTQDRQLMLFILTRALLTATALAPPFMVALTATDFQEGFAGPGWLLLASSMASLTSSYIWGRLSDRSSRYVLLLSGLLGGIALTATSICTFLTMLHISWLMPVLLFGLMVAYQGVRLGRSTHLVDMASENKRAAYTALSNTIIGVILIAGGAFSIIASLYGEITVLIIFALMCFASAISAYLLEEAQDA